MHADDVRGNLTLPATGQHATTFGWTSSDPCGGRRRRRRAPSGGGPAAGRRHAHRRPAPATAATATRSIVVRVKPLPAAADYDAYAFAYFAGESTDDGEKIYLGASKGNDPLDYDELNDGRPVLSSQFGTKGLRDPFIIRSAEGDQFYLLATDLKAYPAVDFGEAQETGSKYMEIWESTDLVHWSDQRHVKVSSDFAGNTWAPEAFYDEAAGEYVVYWASALYPTTDTAGRDINTSYQRMMYATTRDFVTFSDPKPWIDVKRGTGRGMIDATVVKDGDTYYRVVKDEASMTPRQEKSTDLRATVTGSLATTTSSPGWQLVKERVGVGQPNPWGGTFTNGEGPTVFRDNEDPDRWYMFIDQPSYHGGRGYLAFRTDDIASGNWTSVPGAELPSSPRHGTVLPVTQAELDGMRAAYQPELLVESVEDVCRDHPPGRRTDPAGDRRGHLRRRLDRTRRRWSWDDVDPAAVRRPRHLRGRRHRGPRLGRPAGRDRHRHRRRRPAGQPRRRRRRRPGRLVGQRPGRGHRDRHRRHGRRVRRGRRRRRPWVVHVRDTAVAATVTGDGTPRRRGPVTGHHGQPLAPSGARTCASTRPPRSAGRRTTPTAR